MSFRTKFYIRTPYDHFLAEAKEFIESPTQATKIWDELISRSNSDPLPECVYDEDEGRILTVVATKFLRDIRRVAKEFISLLTDPIPSPNFTKELPSEYFAIYPVRPHFKPRCLPIVSFLDGMTHIENDRHFVIFPSTFGQEVFLDAHGNAWAVLLKSYFYSRLPGMKESNAVYPLPLATPEKIMELLQPDPYIRILSIMASASSCLSSDILPDRFLSLLTGESLLIDPAQYVKSTLQKHRTETEFTKIEFLNATPCLCREEIIREFRKRNVIVKTFDEEKREAFEERFEDGIMTLPALYETRGVYWNFEEQNPWNPTYAQLELERISSTTTITA